MATLARTQHKVSPRMSESVTPRLHAGCLPSRASWALQGAKPDRARRDASGRLSRPGRGGWRKVLTKSTSL